MPFISSLPRWILVLSMVGYTIVAVTTLALGVETRVLAISLRLVVALASVIVLFASFPDVMRARPSLILVAFLILYMCRMIADQGRYESSLIDLLFYIGATLAPTFALMFLALRWDDARSATLMAIVGSVACAAVVAANIFGISDWRLATSVEAGRFSYDILDPITVGNVGAITALAGLCRFGRGRSLSSAAVMALGIVVLGMGLSRGPIVAFGACLAAYFWISGKKWALIAAASAALAMAFTGAFDATLETLRLSNLEQDEAANVRVMLLFSSLDHIAQSPLFGISYMEPTMGMYPHNVFVEAALSLGVVGFVLFLYLLCSSTFWGVDGAKRRGDLFVFLLLVYWVVESQFSGAIWSNTLLWISMATILGRKPVRIAQYANLNWPFSTDLPRPETAGPRK